MKKPILPIINLLCRIYASYFLVITALLTPPMIWLNQTLVFSVIPPLFLSSKLKQNVLDALNIIIFNSSKSTVFIQSELNHLRDVHVLLVYFYLIGLINLIFITTCLRLRRPPRKYFVVTTGVIVIVSVLAALFFDTFFELFHQVLFPQGNFAFPWDSMLIQTFPPEFWFLQFVELQAGVVSSILVQALLQGRIQARNSSLTQSRSADEVVF